MLKVCQYNSEEERTELEQTYSDLFIVEIRNLYEGKFLVFSDSPLIEKMFFKTFQKIVFLNWKKR